MTKTIFTLNYFTSYILFSRLSSINFEGSVLWTVYIVWILTSCQSYHLQILSAIQDFFVSLISFDMQKFLSILKSHLCFCLFVRFCFSFRKQIKKYCYGLCQSFLPMFSSKSFMVSGLTFRSLISCLHAKSLQSYQTLSDPMNWGLPGSSAHGILQAKILEWVAMPYSMGSSRPRD